MFLTDGLRVVFERQLGLLIRESDMHSTTFTIESVHGVKQTFVLGQTTKTGNGEASNQSASETEKNASDDQGPLHPPR